MDIAHPQVLVRPIFSKLIWTKLHPAATPVIAEYGNRILATYCPYKLARTLVVATLFATSPTGLELSPAERFWPRPEPRGTELMSSCKKYLPS